MPRAFALASARVATRTKLGGAQCYSPAEGATALSNFFADAQASPGRRCHSTLELLCSHAGARGISSRERGRPLRRSSSRSRQARWAMGRASAPRPWSSPMRSDAAPTLSTRRPSTWMGGTDERLARSAGCEVQGDRAERGHAPNPVLDGAATPLLSGRARRTISEPGQETASPATGANGRGGRRARPRAAAPRMQA